MTTDNFSPKTTSLEQVQRINTAMITDGLVTPDEYYLDLSLLKDIRVGAVVAAIYEHPKETHEALYAELVGHMTEYQKRSFDNDAGLRKHSCYARSQELFKDPTKHSAILAGSPMTPLLKTLDAHIVINANHSQVGEKFTKQRLTKSTYRKDWRQITFHVNVYPFAANSDAALFISAFLLDRYGVNVSLVSHAPREIPGSLFGVCEEFFVYRLDAFTDSPEVKGLLEPLMNMKKSFFCSPIFPQEKSADWSDAQLRLERRSLKAYLDMFITLEWIPPESYCPLPSKAPSMEHFLY